MSVAFYFEIRSKMSGMDRSRERDAGYSISRDARGLFFLSNRGYGDTWSQSCFAGEELYHWQGKAIYPLAELNRSRKGPWVQCDSKCRLHRPLVGPKPVTSAEYIVLIANRNRFGCRRSNDLIRGITHTPMARPRYRHRRRSRLFRRKRKSKKRPSNQPRKQKASHVSSST